MFGDPADVCVRNGDGIFFINFRADRGRELVSAFHFPVLTGSIAAVSRRWLAL